jgi:SagB-type dehydrogenase family enzyme
VPKEYIFEVYHENSKLSLWDIDQIMRIRHINESGALGLLADSQPLDGSCFSQTILPKPMLPNTSLKLTFHKRRSALNFTRKSISLAELSSLLHYSFGLNGALRENGHPRKALRFCPSPGGLYPLSVFVEARRVKNLKSGFYYYDAYNHSIGHIASCNRQKLLTATEQGGKHLNCACLIWLFCRFDRLSFKYGERSYRFALLEAGHVAQNILLISATLSLASRPYAGFLDDVVIESVGLDGLGLIPLYFIGVGYEANQ